MRTVFVAVVAFALATAYGVTDRALSAAGANRWFGACRNCRSRKGALRVRQYVVLELPWCRGTRGVRTGARRTKLHVRTLPRVRAQPARSHAGVRRVPAHRSGNRRHGCVFQQPASGAQAFAMADAAAGGCATRPAVGNGRDRVCAVSWGDVRDAAAWRRRSERRFRMVQAHGVRAHDRSDASSGHSWIDRCSQLPRTGLARLVVIGSGWATTRASGCPKRCSRKCGTG